MWFVYRCAPIGGERILASQRSDRKAGRGNGELLSQGSNASEERAFAQAIDEKHIGTQFLAHRSKLTPDKGGWVCRDRPPCLSFVFIEAKTYIRTGTEACPYGERFDDRDSLLARDFFNSPEEEFERVRPRQRPPGEGFLTCKSTRCGVEPCVSPGNGRKDEYGRSDLFAPAALTTAF